VTKNDRRPVNGVLLLDKPVGWTSNAALQTVKRLYRAQKAGHTGSLKKPVIPVVSIHWPAACCQFVWAKPPNCPGYC